MITLYWYLDKSKLQASVEPPATTNEYIEEGIHRGPIDSETDSLKHFFYNAGENHIHTLLTHIDGESQTHRLRTILDLLQVEKEKKA
jgi:hypothetical protein